jgi:hypothetical protein
MTKDYRGATGVIGKWKGYEVYVLTKEQYMDTSNKSDYTVYAISDDNCRMIHKGDVVGVLDMSTGTVIEMARSKYTPVRKVVIPASVAKVEDENEYDKYANVVNEFFKHLQDPIIVE